MWQGQEEGRARAPPVFRRQPCSAPNHLGRTCAPWKELGLDVPWMVLMAGWREAQSKTTGQEATATIPARTGRA